MLLTISQILGYMLYRLPKVSNVFLILIMLERIELLYFLLNFVRKVPRLLNKI